MKGGDSGKEGIGKEKKVRGKEEEKWRDSRKKGKREREESY